jgi:DNA-binding NarL/FixJ family response regulator
VITEIGTIRVAILDGQLNGHRGFIDLCDARDDIEVSGTSTDVNEAVTLARSTQPDVIIIDPETIPVESVSTESTDSSPFKRDIMALRNEVPNTSIAVLTNNDSTVAIRDSIVAGAKGYLLKGDEPNDLCRAVMVMARGGSALSDKLTGVVFSVIGDLNERVSLGGDPLLTKREIDVLSLVGQGKTNRQIARELYIADNTVKNHVRNILEKLGVHTRMEAVERAVSSGVLPQP